MYDLRRCLPRGLPVLLLILAGCNDPAYQIRMAFKPEGFTRELSGKLPEPGPDDPSAPAPSPSTNEVARLSRVYATSVPPVEAMGRWVFTGQFTTNTPADLGGSGCVLRETAPVGRWTRYLEQFGPDGAQADRKQINACCQRIAKHLEGWLSAELGRDRKFRTSRKALFAEMERHADHIAEIWCTASLLGQYSRELAAGGHTVPESSGRELTRLILYGVEQGLVRQDELPMLLANGGSVEGVAGVIRRTVMHKVGYAENDPLPPSMAFLKDFGSMTTSLTNYLAGTDEYKRKLKEWSRKDKTEADTKPDPMEVMFGDPLKGMFTGARTVQLEVLLPVEPLETNGRWNNETLTVSWDKRELGGSLPPISYAEWVEPQAMYQEGRFGRLLLQGDSLKKYLLARAGLSFDERARLDGFIDGLKPGPDLVDKIKVFSLGQKSDEDTDRFEPCRNILINRLTAVP